MKKLLILSLIAALTFAFAPNQQEEKKEKEKINTMLDAWHKAAADANFVNYFDLLTKDAIFMGTDPTENWNKTAFMTFAKPYFDKGKAWDFKALERHIYFGKDKKTAWFDELLNTQMKICRGSGVLVKVGDKWKIQHYVLSMTIPNDNTAEVVKIKTPFDNILIEKLSTTK